MRLTSGRLPSWEKAPIEGRLTQRAFTFPNTECRDSHIKCVLSEREDDHDEFTGRTVCSQLGKPVNW